MSMLKLYVKRFFFILYLLFIFSYVIVLLNCFQIISTLLINPLTYLSLNSVSQYLAVSSILLSERQKGHFLVAVIYTKKKFPDRNINLSFRESLDLTKPLTYHKYIDWICTRSFMYLFLDICKSYNLKYHLHFKKSVGWR